MLDLIVGTLDGNQYGELRCLSTTYALADIVYTWFLATEERKDRSQRVRAVRLGQELPDWVSLNGSKENEGPDFHFYCVD